ncbi:uncharacterized protein LOC135464209 [Liolophura sinensis]|uniref:uncharacterized protein LOC135464209 n=1 Tax=Liolophura sinensis TaxID=3198878 RepID=UPI00315962A6
MGNNILMAVILIYVTAAIATQARAGKKDQAIAEGVDTVRKADSTRILNKRELRELAANFREAMMRKRGLFDCANYQEECHIFKHCCGDFLCSRANVFGTGICSIEV